MSLPKVSRRAVAVLQSGPDQPTRPMIGNRSLHQYWALLMQHFRGVLLPPQCRSDDASTQWSWREPADNPPLNSQELATVRKRLTGAQRSLADAVEDAPVSAATGPHHTASILPQIQARMNEVIAALVAQPDAALATYVVRSERGLMLHSWGLMVALTPHYPDATECEIAGTVLVANAPAPDQEVLLESTDGTSLARTRSDAAGSFHFQKISSGRYRVRVVSTRVAFPPEGVTVDIERTSVTGLELRDSANDRAVPAHRSPSDPRRRFGLILLLALLILVVTGGVWWLSSAPRAQPTAPSASPIGANVASDTFGQAYAGTTDPARPTAAVAGVVPSSETKPKVSPGQTPPPHPPPADLQKPDSGRQPTVTIERRAAGFAGAAAGSPANSTLPASAATAGVPSANTGLAANASSGAGAAAAGNASSAAAAPASAAASAFSAASTSPTSAASSSAAVASATATPAPPDRNTPTPTPPAASPAFHSSPPAPSALPEANPAQPTPPPAVGADHANTGGTPADRPLSAIPEPDSAADHTPSPDTSASPSKDRPPEGAARQDKTTLAINVSMPAEPASPSPSATMSAKEDRAYPASTAAAPDLRRRMRLRITPWQPRLLQDTILPTVPTRVGEDDAIETLRARLLRERQAQIPLTLKHPVTQVGFTLELPAAETGSPHPRWRDATGAPPANATVVGTRAEISRPGNAPLRADSTLLADDGRELARVTFGAGGGATLVTAPGVSGWPWIAVERAPADDAGSTAAEWSARLEWQVLGGAPAPATWRRDDHWLDNRGHRLELILGERERGPGSCDLALVDHVTGWAIVSHIEQTQEVPESTAPHAP